MRTVYLRKEYGNNIRKVLLDMAYLVTHKKIRMRKELFEEGLYLLYKKNKSDEQPDKFYLSKDKIKSEDADHYFFDFPFKPDQVEEIAV